MRRWVVLVLLVLLTACGSASSAGDTAAQSTAQPSARDLNFTVIPQSVTSEGYHVLGQSDAPVTITFYSDFSCNTCASYVTETEPRILQEYVATGKVKIVYRHLLQLGESSEEAAEASECAADQDKFWQMREQIYLQQTTLYGSKDEPATLTAIAKDVGLDTDVFARCLESKPHRAAIDADFRAATAAGVLSRPVFEINGQRLVGALPFDSFKHAIEGK